MQSVDYKGFSLKKLNTPEFRHVKLLLFWPIFGILFMLLERFFSPEFHTVYSRFDDMIPFCEFFVIPYYFWFIFLIGIQIYGFFFDIPCFEKYMKFTIITYMTTILIYIIDPTSQNLRPASFERNNIFTGIVTMLYGFDTNTNVCPSLHVIGALATYFAARKSEFFGTKGWRIAFLITTLLICASTVFLKQHSVVDIFWGVVVSLVFYPVVFYEKKTTAVRDDDKEKIPV